MDQRPFIHYRCRFHRTTREELITAIGGQGMALARPIAELKSTYETDFIARRAIQGLIAASLGFILLSVSLDLMRYFGKDIDPNWTFSINRERSVPEFYGYAESLTTAILLLICHIRLRTRAFLFWALFFAFVLADDSLSYHERFGKWLVETANLPTLPGLRPIDTGEIVAWSIAAIVLMAPLLWSLVVRTREEISVHLVFGTVFSMLVFFAVVVDMAHEAVSGPLNRVVNWIEDGGEMLCLAAGVSCALLFYRSARRGSREA